MKNITQTTTMRPNALGITKSPPLFDSSIEKKVQSQKKHTQSLTNRIPNDSNDMTITHSRVMATVIHDMQRVDRLQQLASTSTLLENASFANVDDIMKAIDTWLEDRNETLSQHAVNTIYERINERYSLAKDAGTQSFDSYYQEILRQETAIYILETYKHSSHQINDNSQQIPHNLIEASKAQYELDKKPSAHIPDFKTMLTEVRTPGFWNGHTGDMIPLAMQELLPDYHIRINGKNIKETTSDSHINVIDLKLSNNHYNLIVDGKEIHMPDNGDCFFHAILEAQGLSRSPENIKNWRDKVADIMQRNPTIYNVK